MSSLDRFKLESQILGPMNSGSTLVQRIFKNRPEVVWKHTIDFDYLRKIASNSQSERLFIYTYRPLCFWVNSMRKRPYRTLNWDGNLQSPCWMSRGIAVNHQGFKIRDGIMEAKGRKKFANIVELYNEYYTGYASIPGAVRIHYYDLLERKEEYLKEQLGSIYNELDLDISALERPTKPVRDPVKNWKEALSRKSLVQKELTEEEKVFYSANLDSSMSYDS